MADTNPPSTTANDNQAIIDAVSKLSVVEVLTIGGTDPDDDPTIEQPVHVLSVPQGRKIEPIKKYLDEYRSFPERQKGTSEMFTITSFVDQVNRSKDEDSVIFADVSNRGSASMVAIIDYNHAGSHAQARFGEHRVKYRFPLSDQWKAWTGRPIENIAQRDFAEFIESRIMDIVEPTATGKQLDAFSKQLGITLASPQRMMTLSRGLEVNADQKVMQNINVGSGETSIAFSEEHTDQAGAPLKIPGGFGIAIPIFMNGPAYLIPVRLRYRVAGGQVKWTLQPQRLNECWDDAVTEAVNAVTTKTSLVTLFGTPE